MKRSTVLASRAVLSALVLCAATLFGCSGSEDDDGGGGLIPVGGGGSGGTAAGNSGSGGTGGTVSEGGTAGTDATAGTDGGGSGGTGAGGEAGAGGAPVAPSIWDQNPTSGCGKEPPAGQAFGDYTEYTIQITGETLGTANTTNTEREIFVWLPANYDKDKAYRVVFITVGCSAANGRDSAYRLMAPELGGTEEAIYVALSLPVPFINNNCYDNRGGINSIEWESLDLDHKFVAENFCVDDNRIYTGGYSTGGWTSNMWSCYFGGIEPTRKFGPDWALRGAMGVSGCWVDGNPECNGPVAQLWIHDESEIGANAYSCAREQLARVLDQTGCEGGVDGPKEVWGEDFFLNGECEKYTSCPAEYPVIFCTTSGQGHGSQNANAITGFTKFMDLMEPGNRPAQ